MSDKKEQPEQKIEKPLSLPRRNVVKTTVLGSAAVTGAAVSGKWAKPVVDSVILPAHAVTSEVAADDGAMEPEPPTPRNFFGAVNNMITSLGGTKNDTQVADSKDNAGLLQSLAKLTIDTIVPKAHAQNAPSASLCVAENQGAVDIVLQLVNPFTPFIGLANGTVNFTGSGMLGSPVALTTTCQAPPELELSQNPFGQYVITLTDTMDGNLMYSLEFTAPFNKGSNSSSGSIPEGACGQGAEMCPTIELIDG